MYITRTHLAKGMVVARALHNVTEQLVKSQEDLNRTRQRANDLHLRLSLYDVIFTMLKHKTLRKINIYWLGEMMLTVTP